MADKETNPDEQIGSDDTEGHRRYETPEEGAEERMRTSAHGSAQDDKGATDTPDEDREARLRGGVRT